MTYSIGITLLRALDVTISLLDYLDIIISSLTNATGQALSQLQFAVRLDERRDICIYGCETNRNPCSCGQISVAAV